MLCTKESVNAIICQLWKKDREREIKSLKKFGIQLYGNRTQDIPITAGAHTTKPLGTLGRGVENMLSIHVSRIQFTDSLSPCMEIPRGWGCGLGWDDCIQAHCLSRYSHYPPPQYSYL